MPNIHLFIWRHAEADDSSPDIARPLTARGHRDAARVAKALAKKLDETAIVISSPAVRTRETVEPLIARASLHLQIDQRLAAGAALDELLDVLEHALASANSDEPAIVLVGHQPWCGQLARRLLTDTPGHMSIKKASAWWLVRRTRDGASEWMMKSVLDPDLV